MSDDRNVEAEKGQGNERASAAEAESVPPESSQNAQAEKASQDSQREVGSPEAGPDPTSEQGDVAERRRVELEVRPHLPRRHRGKVHEIGLVPPQAARVGEEDEMEDHQDRGRRKPDGSLDLPDHGAVSAGEPGRQDAAAETLHAVAVRPKTNDLDAVGSASTFSATITH